MASVRRMVGVIAASALAIGVTQIGTASAAPTQTPSVCKLITTKEAARILDTPVNKGKPKKASFPPPGTKASQCEWASKKKGVGGIEGSPLKLQVEVSTGATIASDYEKAKAKVGFEDLKTVPDLGMQAFYDDRPFSGVHVLVTTEQVLSVKVTNFNTAKAKLPKSPEEMSIDAAGIAVGRLTSTA